MEQSICKIKSLCFKLLIVCLFNCQVCFSQVTTSINISLKQHIGNINATALSVDGKHLASVSSDMSIKIWRYPEYNLMTTIVLPRRKGSLSQLDCIKFHPLYPNLILVSGGILIDGYLDEESKVEYYIYIIDWKKKILIDQIGGFKSYITSMDFSNSGETLIASSAYQNFNLYNSKNMEIICKGEINDEEIYSAKFLQDSLFIINSDLHKRTYRLCKNNRVKIVDKLSRRATNRAYSADSSNDYMVGNIEKLQYREYGGADIKYKNDTLYIQYNNEPLRCFIWPTKVIAVESNLKSNSKTMPGDYNISDFFMGTLMLNGDYIDTERYLLVQKRDFAGTGIYWSTVLPAVAKTRPILINNNYFVLSLSDGTIRWYSSETGKEQLALFIDKEGEYILWLPDGRYYSPSISNSHMIEWRYQNFMNITTKNARTERGKQYDIEAVYNKLKNIYKHKNIYQEITGINLSNYIRSGSPMEYIYNNLQNGKLLRSRKLKEVILQSKLKEESLSKINTYSIFPKIKIDSLYRGLLKINTLIFR